MKRSVSDHPIFFLSYDEPEAEQTYRDLSAHAPCPIVHVQGVRGPDAALRQCAEQSPSERFLTISGDSRVNPALFFQRVEAVEADVVQVFRARNAVNGLEYDHGGVKIWPRAVVLHHPTREAARAEQAFVDVHYRRVAVDFLGSTTRIDLSPLQAYRAGYREALRLMLIQGMRLRDFSETWERMSPAHRSRLLVWASVGGDVENGWWSIYGVRQSVHDFWVSKYSHLRIHEYDTFGKDFPKLLRDVDPEYAAKALRRRITTALPDFPLADLENSQSHLVKMMYVNPQYSGPIYPDSDVLFT